MADGAGSIVALSLGALVVVPFSIGGALGYTLAFNNVKSHDIQVELTEKSKEMAKYGEVSAELACQETTEFQKSLNEYFNNRSSNAAVSIVLTQNDCLEILKAQQALSLK